MSIVRRSIVALAALATLGASSATPASAATSVHCGERASWTRITDSTSKVKVDLYWRWAGDRGGALRVCAKAVDVEKSKSPIVLTVDVYGYDKDRSYQAKAGNSVELALTTDSDVYGIVARGQVSSTYPGWTLVAWNR